jgi:hypothetical protein
MFQNLFQISGFYGTLGTVLKVSGKKRRDNNLVMLSLSLMDYRFIGTRRSTTETMVVRQKNRESQIRRAIDVGKNIKTSLFCVLSRHLNAAVMRSLLSAVVPIHVVL